MEHGGNAPASIDQSTYDRRWYTLSVLCLSLLIVSIGNSSLNVAIPTLSRDLAATSSQLEWVVAIYSLVFAGLLFTTGALGDRFGRKGALQAGLVVFVVGAALASASSQMWEIIGCRAIMGLGGALIMPSTLSILVNVFPPHERAKAIAIWAGTSGGGGAFGPLVSGWLLGHFWYGSVFLVNVPIIAIALVAGHFFVPSSKDPDQGQIDPGGAILSIIGISALVYGLIEAPDKGWTSATTLLTFAVAVVVMVGFVFWEMRVAEPMLDMSFFRNAAFSTATGGMILLFLSMYGLFFLITQYLQLTLGYSALVAALRLAPVGLIMMVVAPTTPKFTARFGTKKTVSGGMLLIAVGMVMFRGLALDTSYLYLIACFVVFFPGMALSMSPMTASIMSAVPARRAGAGSAMNDATRELGSSLGVAILGSLAASQFTTTLKGLTRGLDPVARATAESSLTGALQTAKTLPASAAAALSRGANLAFLDGLHLAVTVGAIVAASASLLVYRFLPERASIHGGHDAGARNEDSIESLETTATLGLGGVEPLLMPGD